MKSAVFLLCLIVLGGCSTPTVQSPDTLTTASPSPQSEADLQAARTAPEPTTGTDPVDPPGPATPRLADRKIVRNAIIEFKVADFRASAKRITALVSAFHGLLNEEQETRENDQLKSQMTIRVPSAQLTKFLDTLLRESVYTRSKSISAEDVTKRFVDTEARIRSQKATEERYRQLLKQARTVKDVLEVDEQLRAIRETVEIQEAELRELKNDVSMSTVSLTFYQDTEATSAPEAPYIARFWMSTKSGFGLIGDFFLGLAYLFPLLAILGGIGWVVARWFRGRKQKT